MRLLLPAAPSSYVLGFLFAACKEAQRVGAHTLPHRTLRTFSAALANKGVDTYQVSFSFARDSARLDSFQRAFLQGPRWYPLQTLSGVLRGSPGDFRT